MCGTITGGQTFRRVGGEKEAPSWCFRQRLWLWFRRHSFIFPCYCVCCWLFGVHVQWPVEIRIGCRCGGPIRAWPLITVLLIYWLYSAVSFGVQTKAEPPALLLFLIVLFTGGVGAPACSAGSRALASEVNLIQVTHLNFDPMSLMTSPPSHLEVDEGLVLSPLKPWP